MGRKELKGDSVKQKVSNRGNIGGSTAVESEY
jgi:hypothetical protein